MAGLSTFVLVPAFTLAGVATWIAGTYLSRTTDSLDVRFNLGDALGGLILLAITGTLPEIAITVSAALSGHLELAVGNLIGGIAMQTLVLVVLDFAAGRERPLSFLIGSLIPVLEALMVIVVLSVAMAGAALPKSTAVFGASPTSIAIVVFWVIGVWMVKRVKDEANWIVKAPDATPGRRHRRDPHPSGEHPYARSSTTAVILIFTVGAVVTLTAGVILQASGNVLANRMGIQGVVFGATILAFVTALPEISSGIAAIRLGDIELAVSDILGGNSFQICLLLVADLVAGTPVMLTARGTDVWLGGLGLLMTGVAAASIIFRPKRTYLWLGADSIVLVIVYAAAILYLPSVV